MVWGASFWRLARQGIPRRGLVVGVGASVTAASSWLISGTPVRLEEAATTSIAVANPDACDFDVYLETPTADDLPTLLREFQAGKEVWPWIWTQPNVDGPHDVYVLPEHAMDESSSLTAIQTFRINNPGRNVMLVIPDPAVLDSVPKELLDHCGVVQSNIALLNHRHKILMLEDERVVCFDRLTIL